MMPVGPRWSAAELTDLRELVKLAWSASKIAAELTARYSRPFTRNAVIGRVHRLNASQDEAERIKLMGKPLGGRRMKALPEPEPKVVPAPTQRLSLQEALRGFTADAAPEPLEHVDFYGVALPPDDRECHYIHGDPKLKNHVYCRHPVLRLGPDTYSVYCPYHAAVCHRDARNYRDLSEILGLE